MSELLHHSVAVLEVPHPTDPTFVMEGPDPLRFIGGKVNPGEDPLDAMNRELAEELGLPLVRQPECIWKNTRFRTQTRMGQYGIWVFNLYLAEVSSFEGLQLQEGIPGELVPVRMSEIAERRKDFTDIAWAGLNYVLAGRGVIL